MNVASGVILIIAAVFNLFASFGYLVGGGLATGVGMAPETMQQMAQQAAMDDGQVMTMEEKATLHELSTQSAVAGGGLLAWGIFLLVSVGILIAGAVFLFQGQKPGFIYGAAAVAILVEVGGMLITAFGVTNLVGIIGGLMAIIAARSIASSQGADSGINVA
jgi:hypothetical protein